MKRNSFILVLLIAAVIIFTAYSYTSAGSNASQNDSIAVVNIRTVFTGCKRNADYRSSVEAEQDAAMAELEKLRADLEAAKAGLKTLKKDSSDYLEQARDVLTREANLQAQQEFYKRHLESKDQQWTEKIYKDLLSAVSKVALEKDIDLVMAVEDVETPMPDAQELMMAIRTNKVLYSGGCRDISDDVLKELDSME